ncbi:hypothetical protein CEXT_97601 [Caerostris extrusa]|uniref:Uncharacterized protein n=1 Tax=Caerostris extrusa TaxID=172846 RepID=A0AAV4XG86_CAEEX|nr:hypothetical protein CEXT_97601 [Caerostris extrusa]
MSQLVQLEAHLSTGRQIFLTPTQFRFAEPVRAASLAKRVHNETTHTSPLLLRFRFLDPATQTENNNEPNVLLPRPPRSPPLNPFLQL